MKLILKILAVFVALVLIAVLALVLFFDLNMFKPRIEAAAREQGVALRIGGDLGWTFWPSIGVTVNDIHVAAASEPEQSIARLNQASLLVALKPLFSGNLQVHHILVDGAVIDLVVDEQGEGNWEELSKSREAEQAPTPTTSETPADQSGAESTTAQSVDESKEFTLAIERISLHNSALRYTDKQTGQGLAVEDIQVDITQFNLQGEPFDLKLALKTTLADNDEVMTIGLSVANRVQFTADFSALTVSNGELNMVLNERGNVAATYQLTAENLSESAQYKGSLKVPAFDARTLLSSLGTKLETREASALTSVALDAAFNGDTTQINVDPLTIKLDKTTLTGNLAITDFATSAIRLVLNGDVINVDDYLAPPAPKAEPAATADASGDEELIPLETVRALNADIRVDFGKMTVMDLPLEKLQLRVNAKEGVVNLQQADAGLYQGKITSKGSLDARGNTAAIQFSSNVNGVQLAPALKDLALDEKIQLTGAVNADAKGTTRGVTMNQLMDSLVSEANFSGAEWRFAPLNIEQKFCQLVNLVNKLESDPQRAWDAFTEMSQLTGKVTMANRIINVESFNAGVHQLLLGTQGKLNLKTDEYDFTLPLKLLEEQTSEKGCRVSSNYWINRSLSLLRCKGSLATLNPVNDCRLDSKGLTSLTKDLAEFKLREKHGDKIDAAEQKLDEKKDELRQKLNEKLGGDTQVEKENPRDILKGLLKKKLEEKTAPAPEAAPATPAEPESNESEGSATTP